ncbi:hypothetical protein Pelo_16971 [Pelomyxa schiedti]|nr:hypothetical protein Pelo_16971 [Pelomyxa schiedti]
MCVPLRRSAALDAVRGRSLLLLLFKMGTWPFSSEHCIMFSESKGTSGTLIALPPLPSSTFSPHSIRSLRRDSRSESITVWDPSLLFSKNTNAQSGGGSTTWVVLITTREPVACVSSTSTITNEGIHSPGLFTTSSSSSALDFENLTRLIPEASEVVIAGGIATTLVSSLPIKHPGIRRLVSKMGA